jgi:hypothetical protein
MTYWSGYVSCHMAITMTMIKNKKVHHFAEDIFLIKKILDFFLIKKILDFFEENPLILLSSLGHTSFFNQIHIELLYICTLITCKRMPHS